MLYYVENIAKLQIRVILFNNRKSFTRVIESKCSESVFDI